MLLPFLEGEKNFDLTYEIQVFTDAGMYMSYD